MEYKILFENDRDKLSEKITDLLSQGWSLHGSMQMAMTDNYHGFSQALTRTKKQEGLPF